jgi:hypothetical protein
MLPQRQKLISGKTCKTPEWDLKNKLSWFLYFSWFSHTLSTFHPEVIRNSLASHSRGSELKSRHKYRLPWGFSSVSSISDAKLEERMFLTTYFLKCKDIIIVCHLWSKSSAREKNGRYCDVCPESQNVGTSIYDCFLDNGLAKHVSPITNQAITQQSKTLSVNF